MSKKRDRHLGANETDELKFQIQEERRLYEGRRNAPKASSNPYKIKRPMQSRVNPAFGNGGSSSMDEGCLWSIAKFILVPLVLVCFVAILKACES